MKRTKISELLTGEALGKEVKVSGWVRTFRNDMFIALNDGSSVKNLQCVINQENHPASDIKRLYAGTCISAEGVLKESQGKGQDYELLVGRLEILGEANPDEYPLQPKAHSLEFLREIGHARAFDSCAGYTPVFRIERVLLFQRADNNRFGLRRSGRNVRRVGIAARGRA